MPESFYSGRLTVVLSGFGGLFGLVLGNGSALIATSALELPYIPSPMIAAIFVQVREAEEAAREADLRTTRARVDLVQAGLELDHLTGKTFDRYGEIFRLDSQ